MEYNNIPFQEGYNKFGMYQNPYQSKYFGNQFQGKPLDVHLSLPQIRNKYRDVEDEKLKLVNNTLNFVQKRSKRALNSSGPFTNYPMYNPDISNFLNNYPHSLMHYRPIRYFFQRPVQLDEHTHFPHQKSSIIDNRAQYNTAIEINRNLAKKYAKPLKYKDLINNAQELELPMAKVISAGEVNNKIEELNKVKDELFRLDPQRRKEIRIRNKKHWSLIYKLGHVVNFWNILNEFKVGRRRYRTSTHLLDRAAAADMLDLIKYFGRIVGGLRDIVQENFGAYLVYNSNNEQKNEDSVWVTKRFIQKLFHDLATATTDIGDIDPSIRNIILSYILNGKMIPPNWLSTQEFNRTLWGLDWCLKSMTHERQAMIVNLMVLYKAIILNILNKPELYFKNLESTKYGGTKIKTEYEHDDEKLKEREDQQKEKIAKAQSKFFGKSKDEKELDKLGRKDVMTIVLTNFSIIKAIMSDIVKDAFKNAPNIARETIKDKFMYKFKVYNSSHVTFDNDRKLKQGGDENEFAKLVNANEQASIFIKNNQRWISFYKMNAIGFCMNLVELVLQGEQDRIKKDIQADRDKKVEDMRNRRNDDEM